jgi:hypothetical protein
MLSKWKAKRAGASHVLSGGGASQRQVVEFSAHASSSEDCKRLPINLQTDPVSSGSTCTGSPKVTTAAHSQHVKGGEKRQVAQTTSLRKRFKFSQTCSFTNKEAGGKPLTFEKQGYNAIDQPFVCSGSRRGGTSDSIESAETLLSNQL